MRAVRGGQPLPRDLLARVIPDLAVEPTVLPGLPGTPTRRDDARRLGHVLATTYSCVGKTTVIAGAPRNGRKKEP
jgi:hypothetical protein